MKRILKFWKIVILDTIGVLLMIAALLTGWLPGPGGIPLFIIGLSILAIHHEWAERYIDLLKEYVDRLGDMIFVKDPLVERIYDIFVPFMLAVSAYLLFRHSAVWMITIGILLGITGITIGLGNRNRLARLKRTVSKRF